MASSGAMMALAFLFTIPQFLATGTAPCKKETRSSLRLFRDRRVRKPQTSRRMAAETRSTHLAGRTRPLPAFFCLESSGGAEDLLRAAKCCCDGCEVSVVAESARSGRVTRPFARFGREALRQWGVFDFAGSAR